MTERPSIRVVSAEIQEEGRYLLTQRLAKAVLPLLWEFPGGRVREGESDVETLTRTLRTRIGVAPEVGERLMEVTHAYDHYDLTLAVYRCQIDAEPEPVKVSAVAWVHPDDFTDYPFPDADVKTIDLLLMEG